MPELLEGISKMTSADRQLLLQGVLRAVAKVDGPEAVRQGVNAVFGSADQIVDLKAGSSPAPKMVSPEEFLALVNQGLVEWFSDK